MQSGREQQLAGIALVLVSTIAFAVGPTAARLAFDNGSNVLTVVTLRGVIAAVLMAPLLPLSGQGFILERRALRSALHCGVFYALTVWGFIGAIAHIPINVAVLIFFIHPVLIAVIAHARGSEGLTAAKLVFVLMLLAGLVLVLGPQVEALAPTG